MKKEFDKTKQLLEIIDSKIEMFIEDGKSIDVIISELNSKINRVSNQIIDCFKNNQETRYKYLFTHNQVCMKRINDLEKLKVVLSKDRYSKLEAIKILNLLELKDKLNSKFKVSIPNFKK